MTMQQWLIIGIFIATIVMLIFTGKRPSKVFSAVIVVLLFSHSLSLEDVTRQLGNRGLITLVLLLLVSAAIDKTSLIKRLARRLITASYQHSFLRVFSLAYLSSALLNNTAVVATLIGPVKQNQHHPASKLLLPLSYAAILGGTLTLIGTSTNLIVDSFLLQHGEAGFQFWDFTLYGITAGLACGLLLYLLRPALPNIDPVRGQYQNYFIEAAVSEQSSLVGKTVEQNHLRNLPELFLAELVRDGKLISPVCPDELIHGNDRLIFTGNMQRVDSLQHIDGLTLFAEIDGLLKENLTEVVISNRSRLVGKTIKQVGFRALFDAAVVAIRRDGESISGKLGEVVLQAGDFLVLATGTDFSSRHNLTKNFFIVSELNLPRKLNNWQEALTLGGFLLTIMAAAFNLLPLAYGLILLLGILVLTDVLNNNELKRFLPVNLIMVIVGALSLAAALESSGVIEVLSSSLQPILVNTSPFMALVAVYIMTVLLTEMVTNNAAAALMFPFAWGIAQSLHLPIQPFALAVALAASASFISPFGYQTNLLVFSAGNYRVKDFIRIGLPVSLCYSVIALMLLKSQFHL